jgi:hypothetical protein
VLGGLLLVGLLLRLWAFTASRDFSADEAIPGLMARHIAAGRDLPVFYYGQHYFGAVEAYLVAGLFALVGFHAWLVLVPAVAASLALIPLSWSLAEHLAPRPAGLLAALPVAFAPPALARLFGNSGGGYSLAFALQAAALLCCLRAYTAHACTAARWAALFSLATGVAGWIWQPALIALPPLVLPLLVRHPHLRRPATLARIVAPVAVGLLPPLVYNAVNGWPTLSQLVQYTADQQSTALWRMLLLALGGGDEDAPAINPIQLVITGLAFVVTPLLWRGRKGECAILLGFAALHAAAAHQGVRHLVPVALVGYVLAGAVLARLLARRPYATLPVAALCIALCAWSLQLHNRAPDVFAHDVPSTSDLQTAVAALHQRGLHDGYADYWSAYPVTYLSGESIIVAPTLPPLFGRRVDRYPAYTQTVDGVQDPADLFVLVDRHCDLAPYVQPLDQVAARYRVEQVADWYLIWDIHTSGDQALNAWRSALRMLEVC